MIHRSIRVTLAVTTALAVNATLVAQTTWLQRPPGADPPARQAHVMIWDAANGEIVLFGGDAGGGTPLGDTWTCAGTSWRLHTPATSPSPQFGASMAFDRARGVGVFVCLDPTTQWIETWTWDGANWTQRSPSTRPPTRLAAAIAYDEARQRVVLFGGTMPMAPSFGDTWTWDGSDWQSHSPPVRPGPRSSAAFCYDARRGVCVLFGGISESGTPLGDTWQWNGTSWTQLTPALSPSPVAAGDLVYDRLRDRAVLFGGYGTLHAETWEWDGTTWFPRALGPAGMRHSHRMVFDEGLERPVAFGGAIGMSGPSHAETWEYVLLAPASYAPFGAGCPAPAGVPRLSAVQDGRPWIGERFDLELSPLGPPGSSTPFLLFGRSFELLGGTVPLPLDLGFIGLGGCSLLVSADFNVPLVNRGGYARLGLELPNDIGLLLARWHPQGLVLDTAAAGGAVASDAGHMVIGAK